jgi:hypothetical protein
LALLPVLGVVVAFLAASIAPYIDDVIGIDRINHPSLQWIEFPDRVGRINVIAGAIVGGLAALVVGMAVTRVFVDVTATSFCLGGIFAGVAYGRLARSEIEFWLATAFVTYFVAGLLHSVISIVFIMARDEPWLGLKRKEIHWWTTLANVTVPMWVFLIALTGKSLWDWSWWIVLGCLVLGIAGLLQATGLIVKVQCSNCPNTRAYAWRGKWPVFCADCWSSLGKHNR